MPTLPEVLAPIASLTILSRPSGLTTDETGWKHYAWTVQIKCDETGRESKPIPFRCGEAHKDKFGRPTAPNCADVVHSIYVDSSACHESFDDWCSNFGYDTDSRKALETYLACQESGKAMSIFGRHTDAIIEAASEY